MEDAELDYLYIHWGEHGIQAGNLLDCEGIEKLYDNDEVTIWIVNSYNASMPLE